LRHPLPAPGDLRGGPREPPPRICHRDGAQLGLPPARPAHHHDRDAPPQAPAEGEEAWLRARRPRARPAACRGLRRLARPLVQAPGPAAPHGRLVHPPDGARLHQLLTSRRTASSYDLFMLPLFLVLLFGAAAPTPAPSPTPAKPVRVSATAFH